MAVEISSYLRSAHFLIAVVKAFFCRNNLLISYSTPAFLFVFAIRYIIYNVNKEDYQSCRVSDPKATQVALCDGNGEDSKRSGGHVLNSILLTFQNQGSV